MLAAATIALIAAVLGAPPAVAHEQQYDQVQPPTEEERRAERNAAPDGQAKCVNGVAADTYRCDAVDMLDHLWLEGGTWSNFPYLEQAVAGVSSMDRGLFILRAR